MSDPTAGLTRAATRGWLPMTIDGLIRRHVVVERARFEYIDPVCELRCERRASARSRDSGERVEDGLCGQCVEHPESR